MTGSGSSDTASRDLPSRAGAAARVLLLADDPDVNMATMAGAIGADPAFTSRVLAMANSSYYGLSTRIGTLPYAIAVLGFQTIRVMAVSLAAGLDDANSVPTGFWEQAAVTASAATTVAPIVGASAPDAFCIGLLHNLGAALLHQRHPLPQLCLPYPADNDALTEQEIALYGTGHADAGAELLSSWNFPDRVCELVAAHHEMPLPDARPLSRSLYAARALADVILSPEPNMVRAEYTLQRLAEGRLDSSRLPGLLDRIREQSAALLDGLEAR